MVTRAQAPFRYLFDASIEWSRVDLEATLDQLKDGIRASTQWVLPRSSWRARASIT